MIATIDDRTRDELLMVSAHEGGHAVVSLLLRSKVESADIEVSDDGKGWGKVMHRVPPLGDVPGIAICLAGIAAEHRQTGKIWSGTSDQKDLQDAMEILRRRHGDDAQFECPDVAAGMKLAHEMVCKHWPAVKHIAKRLRARGRLTGAEVKAIFRAHGGRKCTV